MIRPLIQALVIVCLLIYLDSLAPYREFYSKWGLTSKFAVQFAITWLLLMVTGVKIRAREK